ncbi:MAG TPA: YciI family protein [Longimicrobium sp.]|nr:YciI family protein [Longimicrobium sp.]
MRFMLMMHAPYGTGKYEIFDWAPEDFQAHIAFLQSLNKELTEAGEYVEVQGLTPPRQAKLVRAGKDGAPITDGPFPEAKEFLAGYWIVEVDSPERAVEIATKASAAPGPGGVPLNMPIEVREVMSGPPPSDA